jgi:hypothetical protein
MGRGLRTLRLKMELKEPSMCLEATSADVVLVVSLRGRAFRAWALFGLSQHELAATCATAAIHDTVAHFVYHFFCHIPQHLKSQ